MAVSPVERTQVFLCYSHGDIDLITPRDIYSKELSQLLTIYRSQGLAEIWSDQLIDPGAEYLKKIEEAIARTKVALLLLSSAFLASDFIREYELPRLLDAEAAGDLIIIPLLFRICPYKKSGLARFQSAFPISKPLRSMKSAERDRAWIRIGEAIEQALKSVPADTHAQTRKQQDSWVHISSVLPHPSDEQIELELEDMVSRFLLGQKRRGALIIDEVRVGEEIQLTAHWQTESGDQPFAQTYRDALSSDPLLTHMQVLDMDHALKLKDIYVRVQVHREHRFRPSVESTEERVQDPLHLLHFQQKYLEERDHEGMEPLQAIRRYPHCVIVGDPGAGKTTLLKYLVLHCAIGAYNEIADHALFVSLHEFARKSGANRDLLAFILSEWERLYHLPVARARPFLEQQLRAGRMLVLLDALDETMVGEESAVAEQTYQAIHDVVNDFHRAYPQTPMVVTVRKAAYHQHAPLIGFDILEVVDFLPAQVEAFVKNWFQHDPDPERRGMAEGLLTRLRSNPRISALAANPLLLGLIAYTYEENNEHLPNNRADLYKLCVETLLRKWDDKRKIRRAHPTIDTYEQERLLPRLAWYFHTRGVRYFSQRELLTQIKEFAEGLGKPTSEEHLQGILNEITSDNGLLREQAIGYYGFLHLTLQEYFAARRLASMSHGLELLLEHLGHPWWEEVILLYAGQVDDASDLLEHLLSSGGNGEAPEDIFYSKLLLAGHCLAAQVQILRNKQLRAKIPGLLLEKLYSPLTLLQQRAAEGLAEIGRAYPEHEVNNRLFEIIEREGADRNLQLIVLEGIAKAGGRMLQRKLLVLLEQASFSQSVYSSLIGILGQFKDGAMQQVLKKLIANKPKSQNVRIALMSLLGQCADAALLAWLFAFLESEQEENSLADAFFIFNKRKEDISLAIPYALRALEHFSHSSIVCDRAIWLLVKQPSIEHIALLERIIEDRTFSSWGRWRAIEGLQRLNYCGNADMFLRMLHDFSEPESVRCAIVGLFAKSNKGDLIQQLLILLQARDTPIPLRVEAATALIHSHAQIVVPVLWEIVHQEENERFRQTTPYMFLRACILLLDQGHSAVLQQVFNSLRVAEKNGGYHFYPADSARVNIAMHKDDNYATPLQECIKPIVNNADPSLLTTICFDHRIHPHLRRSYIKQIGLAGKGAKIFTPAFLREIVRSAEPSAVRIALAGSLGELATDEETVCTLLHTYQGEDNTKIKDALYTAIYKIARRANVTVVEGDGKQGAEKWRIIRRSR